MVATTKILSINVLAISGKTELYICISFFVVATTKILRIYVLAISGKLKLNKTYDHKFNKRTKTLARHLQTKMRENGTKT